MYLEYHEDGHFEAATGTLQADSTEGIVQYKSCMWIKDTKDGGASDWLTSIAGQSLKKWNQGAEEGDILPLDYYSSSKKVVESSRKPTHAYCHCKGVEFWVTPPNTASETARSNFSDLITPYHLGETASENPSDVPWWLCDKNNRFLAGTCACISCRRASGFDITFWAFIPTSNIFLDASLTRPFPPHGLGHTNDYWGSMRVHTSSKGVNRTFCGKCGATVFWDGGKEKERYGLIDVAVGLLDAGSGARAEELLSWWTRRVSFEEFAVNKSLMRGLSEGLDDWERHKGDRGVAVAR
ncbi:hypothetical protein EKO04_010775 [Ascochyta lentis]|uniref:CENP-V/GFA domain-containing protein n=1 Tax=Ascochyta lentis TaxID=205686 RepID=A0A8H7MFK9_9PLEO|nr:hypothetical protein EKO04_010775 [Ascochyta lentis]